MNKIDRLHLIRSKIWPLAESETPGQEAVCDMRTHDIWKLRQRIRRSPGQTQNSVIGRFVRRTIDRIEPREFEYEPTHNEPQPCGSDPARTRERMATLEPESNCPRKLPIWPAGETLEQR